ncbi:uncharacterized protein LOC126906126 [Daktulosphaira vitifoliae]|uniref:uncharacterized protein LOC126906126 n=1 Tax=Daktulosphaira vitifoliae TaxID=58002 RepID=UPI0021A9E420|nr:uncharacterized protein LOC126906126 [Daktulosphaira vitifoliae]
MSTEQDARLIALVKDRSLIYNNAWKDRRCVDNLWLEISLQMRLPTELCKRKWANLRNTYARHVREEKAGLMYDGGRKPWYLADKMSFLKDYMHIRMNLFDESQSPYSRSPDFINPDYYRSKNTKYECTSQESITEDLKTQPRFEFERLSTSVKCGNNSIKNSRNDDSNQAENCQNFVKEEQQNENFTLKSEISCTSDDNDFERIDSNQAENCHNLLKVEQQKENFTLKSEISCTSDDNDFERIEENQRDPSTRYFFRSMMLDYDKLTKRRRRLFQQKILNNLHELLNEQEEEQRHLPQIQKTSNQCNDYETFQPSPESSVNAITLD